MMENWKYEQTFFVVDVIQEREREGKAVRTIKTVNTGT